MSLLDLLGSTIAKPLSPHTVGERFALSKAHIVVRIALRVLARQ